MALNIAVIYGSVRTERLGIRAARFVERGLRERAHRAELIDPLDYKLPMLDKRHFEYDAGQAPESMERLARAIEKADVFVLICGEYNNGLPPALKNILDHFVLQWQRKISGICTYSIGSYGGVRSEMPLRAVMGKLGAPAVASTLTVPFVDKAFDEQGCSKGEEYGSRLGRMAEELEWYGEALKAARKKFK